jgi:hypothetical protein
MFQMKISKLLSIGLLFAGLYMVSCGDSSDKALDKSKEKKEPVATKKGMKDESKKPIASLTKKEAEAKMKLFLKENSRKYKDYGAFEDMELIGGNFNSDGATDYFYKVNFYPGGDFVYPTHFIFDSEVNEIRELKLSNASAYLHSVDAKSLSDGKIIGSAFIWHALGIELEAYRSVNAEFTIDGNKINYDKKYLAKFKKAEKEINLELEQKQEEMTENMEGENTSEEGDY